MGPVTNLKQSFTALDTEVIRRARQRRQDVIVLRQDRPWLSELSVDPDDLVYRMAKRGALIRLGGGRYAIPSIGSDSAARSTTWQALVHAELSPLGPYYVGFLTALEEHRLTDLSEAEIAAAIGFRNKRLERGGKVAGRPLRVTVMQPDSFAFGIETEHQSRTRRYVRSDIERTLVDCHQRPQMVGSAEVWVRAWGRAFAEERTDVDRLLEYAERLGPSAMRRTAILLSMLGHGERARDRFPARARRADRTIPFVADRSADPSHAVDPYWRVAFNVSRETIEGWLFYGK